MWKLWTELCNTSGCGTCQGTFIAAGSLGIDVYRKIQIHTQYYFIIKLVDS